jgi:hypothetical protein
MRRNDVHLWTPAEHAISAAIQAVEEAGASRALTDAIVLLGKARDRVADHVDGVDTDGPHAELGPRASPILRHFRYEHLPHTLQAISRPVGDLARAMDDALPDGPEKQAGLRKLLEAKDCFVRAPLEAAKPAPCRVG